MTCASPEPDHVPGRLRRGLCERHYRRIQRTGTDAPRPLLDHLTRYTALPNGCWRWDGPVYSNGYARLGRPVHGTRLAHRAFYLEAGREIPAGLDLDHTCHRPESCRGGDSCPHRRCVNPAHGEPVTRAVNLGRGRGRWWKD